MAILFDQRGRPYDDDNPVPTKAPGRTSIVAGEKVIAAAATPEQLADDQESGTVLVQAKSDNLDVVRLGDVNGQYVELDPRQSLSIGVENLKLVYVAVESDGDGVNWLAVL